MRRLFTERHGKVRPRVSEVLDETTRIGLIGLISDRINEEWFGLSFPSYCQDGRGNAGTDYDKLVRMMETYGVLWPDDVIRQEEKPGDGEVFDLIEFSYEHIAEPKKLDVHSYWGHTHYTYDKEGGREKFIEDVNRIFERNGIAFEMRDGEVIHMAPAALHETLAATNFQTGDSILDALLEASKQKFLNRSFVVRRESLEKLWDAWERLKTVEPGKDKKAQMKALLDMASAEPNFRERIEREAVELTEIGNTFMIRHTETNRIPIEKSEHVDYLFHRMFSLIHLLIRSSGRGI